MEYLFSYGTLQKESVQFRLFGRVLQSSADVLKEYKLETVKIKDESFLSKGEYPHQRNAVPSENKNDFIKGRALEMTDEELLITDEYEPKEYKRSKVKLESGKEAWVYLVIQS